MHYQAEVIVIGAGPGGICAALSSAREKKKTILITNRPVLGGNSSSEIRVWTRGATGGGSFFAEEMGIWGELKLKNLYVNSEANPIFWDDVLLDAVLSEPDLTLFLNTHITEVKQGGDHLRSVSGFQMGSEKQLEFTGQYFIDATGDGSIGALCGIPYRVGKESRDEYGESFAPQQGEATTFGNTIFYFTQKGKEKVTYKAPDYAYGFEHIEELLDKGGRIVSEEMDGCDYWWFELGGNKDTIADAQEIALDLKRLVAGVWNYIKNSGKFDADYLTLSWQGNLPGKRESRRMITEWVVRQQDVQARTGFADAAFYGGWYMDFHPSDGINTDEDYCIQIPVQVYGMPFRCLYNRSIRNLLFAGRNIGTSHVAFASSRIMNTCALSGQAAGVLAAYCIEQNKWPEQLAKDDISQMQTRLYRNDMLMPGADVKNPDNLALQAEITVSSTETKGVEDETGSVLLKTDDFIIIPSRAGIAEVLLDSEQHTELKFDCYPFDLPSKLALGDDGIPEELSVSPGKRWYAVPLPEAAHDQFFVLVIKEASGVRISRGDRQLTGFLGGNKGDAELWYPCIRFSNQELYGAGQLVDGYHRPWQSPRLWISAREEQPFVIYSWPEPVTVSQIDLYFNCDLSLELISSRASSWNPHHMYTARTAMPPQLVKDFAVFGWNDDKWMLIETVHNNWERRKSIVLNEAVETKKIMIQILTTYGADHGEVFEADIY